MQKPILILMLIVGLASGCSAPASTPSPVPPPPGLTATSFFENVEVTATESAPTAKLTPTQMIAVQTPSTAECKNPFYPVHNGAWWMYSLSNGSKQSHTMLVSGDNTFTVTVQSGDDTFISEGQCTKAGIVLLDSSAASFTYSGGQGNSILAIQNAEGVTLPHDVKVGDDWSQTLTVSGGDVEGIIETIYSAIGYETVNVPAGMFNALKVEQNGSINMAGQTFNSHAFFWYAQNVGVIKSVIDGVASSELLAFNFP
jgi:hypothetical protein